MEQKHLRVSLEARLDENYNAFVQEWLKLGSLQMIENSAEIAATRQCFNELKKMGLDQDSLEYLCRFQNPLKVVRNEFLIRQDPDIFPYLAGTSVENVVEHICDTMDLDGDYPLIDGVGRNAEDEAAELIADIIDRASEEQKEYLASLERMPPVEIIKKSAETDALNRLLSNLIHDSYDLEYADLCFLEQEDRPLHVLYEFVRCYEEPLNLDAITQILKAYNKEHDSGQVQEGVTMC